MHELRAGSDSFCCFVVVVSIVVSSFFGVFLLPNPSVEKSD